MASSCSPSQWAQRGAGRRWGAEAAFREARLSRDQRPAPGWTEGWCHLPPESQLPWGHGCLPASPHPSGDISVRVRRPGHIHLGEQPNPGLLTSGLCPWSADLCRHSRPLQSVRGLSGPFPGFLRQASGKLAFPGSRRGSRPGPHWENALEEPTRVEGAGAGQPGGGGPGRGTQGFQVSQHPPPAGMLGEGEGM